MSLDCIKRIDKPRVYPWVIIDIDDDNKEISCGATCDEAWCGAANVLDDKLFHMRETLRELLKT